MDNPETSGDEWRCPNCGCPETRTVLLFSSTVEECFTCGKAKETEE